MGSMVLARDSTIDILTSFIIIIILMLTIDILTSFIIIIILMLSVKIGSISIYSLGFYMQQSIGRGV